MPSSSQCQAIQDQITAVEAEIQSLQDIIDDPDLPPRVRAEARKELIALGSQLARLQKALKACLDPCAPIEAQIQADTNQIASLTAQIGTINAQIQALSQQLVGLNAQLAAAQADLQQQQQALAQCQAGG